MLNLNSKQALMLSSLQLACINGYLANMQCNAMLAPSPSGNGLSFYCNGKLIASNLKFKSNAGLQAACIAWAN